MVSFTHLLSPELVCVAIAVKNNPKKNTNKITETIAMIGFILIYSILFKKKNPETTQLAGEDTMLNM